MTDRAGFTGGRGDSATVTIADTGNGLHIEAVLSHAVHLKESEETAVEAALDVIFQSLGRPEWKTQISNGTESRPNP